MLRMIIIILIDVDDKGNVGVVENIYSDDVYDIYNEYNDAGDDDNGVDDKNDDDHH